jgi:filamentous hemagglutinin family protein
MSVLDKRRRLRVWQNPRMNVRIASRLPRFRGILFAGFFAGIIAGLLATGAAFANPQGGKVRHGRVEFQNQGGSLVVRQTSDKAILEWGDFSIRAGERTTFVQPSRQSAVLNRVPGGPVSRLEGRLEANGQVYLINPSGIVVGPGGAAAADQRVGLSSAGVGFRYGIDDRAAVRFDYGWQMEPSGFNTAGRDSRVHLGVTISY